MPKRDIYTTDLFRDWQPPAIAPELTPERVRGASLDVRISRAVGEAMRSSEMNRKEIAEAMSDYLGAPVSKAMLEQYASPAKENQRITLERFIALMCVTKCYGLLTLVCGFVDHVAVPQKYAEIIRLWELDEHAAKLERERMAVKARIGGRL